ncbi:hypothetical protein D3C78_1793550 [compost metagenome]
MKPKRAPELKATIFTGPGVIDAANANAAMDMIKLIAHLLFSIEPGPKVKRPAVGVLKKTALR